MKIVERIASIISYNKLSVRAFELKIGASNGMIGRAISKKTDISAEWLSKIIEIFPETNPYWLLTGRGEMIVNNNDKNICSEQEPIIIYKDNPIKDELIQLQRRHIQLLEEKNCTENQSLGFYAQKQSSELPVVEEISPTISGHKVIIETTTN